MEPPQDILDEPSGVAAFHIYAQSWQTPDTTGSAFLELCKIILDNKDKEEAVYSTFRALHKFACKGPPALDHALEKHGTEVHSSRRQLSYR